MSGDVTSAGIHAFKDAGVAVHDAAKQYNKGHGVAIGRVALYGEVIEHTLGYRAEYAMVDSIDSVIGVPLGKRAYVIRQLREAYCPGTEGNAVPAPDEAAEAGIAESGLVDEFNTPGSTLRVRLPGNFTVSTKPGGIVPVDLLGPSMAEEDVRLGRILTVLLVLLVGGWAVLMLTRHFGA